MDFKVAGTGTGITGIQLDLKIDGINEEIIKATLDQAREARREILRTDAHTTLRQPREGISTLAPRLLTVKINPEKIGMLIGPGGKTDQKHPGSDRRHDRHRGRRHGVHFPSESAGTRRPCSCRSTHRGVKVGKIYEGNVTIIKDFGAFIEILPGSDGLCHISELDDKFVGSVNDVCKVGDILRVKVISIDEHDRVKLSRKVLLREAAGLAPGGGTSQQSAPPRRDEGGGRPPRRDEGGGRPPRRDDGGGRPPRRDEGGGEGRRPSGD